MFCATWGPGACKTRILRAFRKDYKVVCRNEPECPQGMYGWLVAAVSCPVPRCVPDSARSSLNNLNDWVRPGAGAPSFNPQRSGRSGAADDRVRPGAGADRGPTVEP